MSVALVILSIRRASNWTMLSWSFPYIDRYRWYVVPDPVAFTAVSGVFCSSGEIKGLMAGLAPPRA